MAVGITITGITGPQGAQIAAAFDAQMHGRPQGITAARWAELQVIAFIKGVLKANARGAHDAAIDSSVAQVDADFEE